MYTYFNQWNIQKTVQKSKMCGEYLDFNKGTTVVQTCKSTSVMSVIKFWDGFSVFISFPHKIVYRFWPCINITTQERLPSPAVFPRRWSHCQSSTMWAGNTRYLYQSKVNLSLRWNVCRTFYVKATLTDKFSHYCWFSLSGGAAV